MLLFSRGILLEDFTFTIVVRHDVCCHRTSEAVVATCPRPSRWRLSQTFLGSSRAVIRIILTKPSFVRFVVTCFCGVVAVVREFFRYPSCFFSTGSAL
jgi:hypothetical protein